MVELAMIAVGVVIVISIVQSLNRGEDNASKAENPTLVEEIDTKLAEVATQVRKYSEEAYFENNTLSWYSTFRSSVLACMKIAREYADMQEELDGDPALKRIFSDLKAKHPVPEGGAKQLATPDWALAGPPRPLTDHELESIAPHLAKRYRSTVDQHGQFIIDMQAELDRSAAKRKQFAKTMQRVGLGEILAQTFYVNG